jgi:hypothetical protein
MEYGSMKKLCIFLMKVNRWHYLFLGILMCLLVFVIKKDVHVLLPSSAFFNLILPFVIFGILFTLLIAKHTFYSDEEIGTKEANGYLDPHPGRVFGWDHYFPIKINTELSLIKRLCGYVYATLGPIVLIFCGYLLTAIAILIVTN